MRMVAMTIRGWDNHHRNMGVVYTIITDTAKESATQRPNTAGTHDDKLRILFFRQFTDHFSWVVALLFVQLKLQLQK